MTSRWRQGRIALRLRRVLAERARYDAATDEERGAWRDARLAELRFHAGARSPFYRRHHRGFERAPLDELPVLTRAQLVEHYDEILTDPDLGLDQVRAFVGDAGPRTWLRRRYRVGASSGSTGQPALFVFDEEEWTGLLANAARARSLSGPARSGGGGGGGRVRSAKVGSPSPWHLSAQVGATLTDPRRQVLRLAATAPLADLVSALGDWQPSLLTAYPSVLRLLAVEQAEGRLDISPARVFAGGEALTAGTRQLVATAWGAEPLDQYATTEAGFVAAECDRGGHLHVLDDNVLVEVVDEAGRPAPPGELGARLLLTVLGSRTLPLIRYELDDRVRLAAERCPGSQRSSLVIAAVGGRARELVRLAGREGAVDIHPVAFTSVLDTMPLRAWQVIAEPGQVRVLIAASTATDLIDSVAVAVERSLTAAGASAPRVVVERVDEIRRSGSGKAALISSRSTRRD